MEIILSAVMFVFVLGFAVYVQLRATRPADQATKAVRKSAQALAQKIESVSGNHPPVKAQRK